MALLEGTVAFESLTRTEEYEGQDTGRYTITLTLDDEIAEALSEQGVKLRSYEATSQRKFASKFPVKVVDANDERFIGPLTRGSKVRLAYKMGDPHPVHGVPTYLNAVRVLELADDDGAGIDEGF